MVALRALSVEIDRIPLASKEERFGALRYEWWRRALNDVWRGSVPDQPALQALERVLGAGVPLTRYRAQRLVAAAEEEGGRAGAQAQPGSLADLHLAADARCGQLLWLELEAVRGVLGGRARGQGATREEILDVASGAENSAPAPLSSSHAALRADERAVKALGRALGVLRTMRGAAADLMAGKTRFPKDLCDRVGVDWSDVTHGRESRPFVEATRELAGDVQVSFTGRQWSRSRPRHEASCSLSPCVHSAEALGRSLQSGQRASRDREAPVHARCRREALAASLGARKVRALCVPDVARGVHPAGTPPPPLLGSLSKGRLTNH